MEDFLGQTYEVGDIILYAAMSGRCVTMVQAKVLAIRENSVTVEPIDSARWKQHYGRTQYIDSRNGKPFDPHHDKNVVHMEREQGYTHKETGEFLTRDEYYARRPNYNPHDSGPYYSFSRDWDYTSEIWKDYVTINQTKAKVTLKVLQNIVLIRKGDA